MDLFVKCVCGGHVESNTYVAGDGKCSVIIDAGANLNDIFRMVEESGMTPMMVILTHCHFDHIENLNEIRDRYGIPAAIHVADAPFLHDMKQNGSFLFGVSKVISPAERILTDGEILEIGDIKYKIIHTPGHTSGGICVLAKDMIFTGDTLFLGSVGRTDLGHGDHPTLIKSITDKLLPLGDNVTVFPGHGDKTTIGKEKEHNPFLR